MQILTDISELVGAASLGPQNVTVAVAGASVDMFNADIATQAIIEVGSPAAAVTGMTFQVEEWNGTTAAGSTWTAIPNMVGSSITTGPTRQTLLGLRTQRYARVNGITIAAATNSNIPVCGELLGMPKSSGGSGAAGFSNSPSN